MKRTVIITEIPSPYRVPVFNELASRSDLEVHVLFLKETITGRSWNVDPAALAFDHRYLPSVHLRRAAGSGAYLVAGIYRALRSLRPDAIVVGGWNHTAAITASRYCRRRQLPLILWAESTPLDARPGSRLIEALKRSVVRAADRYLVPGSAAAQYVRDLGARPEQIWVAPNAVDSMFWQEPIPERACRDHLVVLSVGRLRRDKGLFELVEAIAALPMLPLRLQIVGDGPDEEALRAHVDAHGQASRVSFLGFRQPAQLPALYAAADIFAFPTWSDPWGLVLNEALGASLPVVTSRVAGASIDLVLDGGTGMVVETRDVAGIAAALARLAADRELRTRLGSAGRRLISLYTPQRMAEGFAEAIHGLPSTFAADYSALRAALELEADR